MRDAPTPEAIDKISGSGGRRRLTPVQGLQGCTNPLRASSPSMGIRARTSPPLAHSMVLKSRPRRTVSSGADVEAASGRH